MDFTGGGFAFDDLATGEFWASLGSIVLANVVLSGDNAVVIAMAARSLPGRQQTSAIVFGSAAAIALRIGLTLLAVELLRWPYLKILGAVLLLYVGISLLAEGEGRESVVKAPGTLGAAVRTILLADLVMSLDNVLAVAAASGGNALLLIVGLAVSIPLIVFGSTMLLKVMERLPFIVTLGAALLGYLAGEMLLTDPAVTARIAVPARGVVYAAGAAGAAIVVATGLFLQRRASRKPRA